MLRGAGFSLPAFTALHSLVALLLAFTAFFQKECYPMVRRALSLRSIQTLVALMVWMVIAQRIHSPTWSEWLLPLAKYRKLLLAFWLIPVFNAARHRQAFLQGYMLMCALTAALWLLPPELMNHYGIPHTKGGIFKNYLETGVCLAYAALIAFQWGLQHSNTLLRVVYWASSLVFSGVVLMNPGRSGYLCLFLLAFTAVCSSLRDRKVTGITLLILALAPLTAYFTVPTVQQRTQQVISEWHHYRLDTARAQNTSLGLRLQFYQHAYALSLEKPLWGWGAGHFATAYQQHASSAALTDNAHNEYLMLAVQFGMPAAILWMLLLWFLWKDAGRLPYHEKILLRGTVLCMTVGCCINSWLRDTTEGHWFAWVVALCLASGLSASVTPASRRNYK